jgi:hypothetical protein
MDMPAAGRLRPGVVGVYGQFDFFSRAAKQAIEELQKASETQKWANQWSGSEADPSPPFTLFL